MADERHDPLWLNASRYGRWCRCTCGWESGCGTPIYAQLAFGRHFLATQPRETQED